MTQRKGQNLVNHVTKKFPEPKINNLEHWPQQAAERDAMILHYIFYMPDAEFDEATRG